MLCKPGSWEFSKGLDPEQHRWGRASGASLASGKSYKPRVGAEHREEAGGAGGLSGYPGSLPGGSRDRPWSAGCHSCSLSGARSPIQTGQDEVGGFLRRKSRQKGLFLPFAQSL